MADEKQKARKETGGLIAAGCLFIGMGVGLLGMAYCMSRSQS